MAEVSIERRFRGSVRLVTLHLWRVARSTDVEDGFREARRLGMLKPEDEAFVRSCLALDGRMEAGAPLGEPPTQEMVDGLQRCAICLNTADPAYGRGPVGRGRRSALIGAGTAGRGGVRVLQWSPLGRTVKAVIRSQPVRRAASRHAGALRDARLT